MITLQPLSSLQDFLIFAEDLSKRNPRIEPYITLQALYEIGKEGKIGRYTLSKILNLEESTTRTLLSHFRKKNIVSSKVRSGHVLSENGRKIYTELKSMIVDLKEVEDLEELKFAPFAYGIVINDFVEIVKKGLEERDEAVKAGGKGITLLICKNGKIAIPGVYDKIEETLQKKIEKQFKTINKCILLIVSADTKEIAKRAMFAVLHYIISKKKLRK